MGENICKQSNWRGINLQDIYTQPMQLNIKKTKTNNPIKKWAEDPNRDPDVENKLRITMG